jgi:hypothetical protein
MKPSAPESWRPWCAALGVALLGAAFPWFVLAPCGIGLVAVALFARERR